jgi:hypothetical protein
MKRVACAALLFLAACHREPSVPINVQLWRADGPWVSTKESSARKARATILVFRSDHEFVMIVGRWEQRGSSVMATHSKIARSQPFRGARDPLCDPTQLRFQVSGNSVIGNAGVMGTGAYSVVTRFVAPTFESYVKEARQSPISCEPPGRK